jgi:hypothetical protein
MIGTYMVDFRCTCGRVHAVAEMLIEDGPTEAGTAAELWPTGDYPPAVADELRSQVWCEQAKEYVKISGPERLLFAPWRRFV